MGAILHNRIVPKLTVIITNAEGKYLTALLDKVKNMMNPPKVVNCFWL